MSGISLQGRQHLARSLWGEGIFRNSIQLVSNFASKRTPAVQKGKAQQDPLATVPCTDVCCAPSETQSENEWPDQLAYIRGNAERLSASNQAAN
jgi:hypothetical protein